MTLKLHLGVVDVPYSAKGEAKESGTQTTGDVAGWLEDKYHVMRQFFEMHKEEVVHDLEEGLQDAFEAMLMEAPVKTDPFLAGTTEIEKRFRDFIDLKELEGVGYPGIPTKAALRGVNHRLKRPYVRRAPRPSFQDTGLYEANFKAWMEEE